MIAQKRLTFASSNQISSLMAKMTYIDGFRRIDDLVLNISCLGMLSMFANDEQSSLLSLFLLHLYRFHKIDGLIDKFQTDAEVISSLQSICFDTSKEGTYLQAKVYDSIRVDMLHPEGRLLVDFLHEISTIPDEWYDEYYPQLFDDLLYSISGYQGKSGPFMQPREFSQLIYSLVDLPQGAKVYDPFAGVATFAIGLPKDASFTGQEINGTTYALALMRMMAHGITNWNIYQEDSFTRWRSQTDPVDKDVIRYDFIVSFPPFGLRTNAVGADLKYEWKSKTISPEEYFICNGRCGLTTGGKIAGVFSPSILYQGGTSGRFRENLVRQSWINTIIELPAGLLATTSIGLCVIIFNNDEKRDGSIRFVDAKSFAERQNRVNVLKVDSLLEAIKSSDPKVVRQVELDEIFKNNCILTPNRYFESIQDKIEIPKGFELVELRDLFGLMKGYSTEYDVCRVIKGRDLAPNDVDTPMSFANLTLEPLRNRRCRILNEDGLLLLKVGQLKPTIYKYDSNVTVVCNPNVVALSPKEELFLPYIVSELRKDYVKRQFESKSTGVAMRSVSQGDLLSIKILMPCDRQLQQASYENEQRLLKEQKLKSSEVDEYLKGEREKIFEMMRIRRHRIKPYFSGMLSNIENILEEAELNPGLSLSSELDVDYTVLDAIKNIKSNLEEANELFKNLTTEVNIGEKEVIDLHTFIQEYRYQRTIPSVQFSVEPFQSDLNEEFPNIEFNRENLKEVFDEIVHNAEKHFTPGTRDGMVKIFSYQENGKYCIQIYNNGEPLPDDFDEEKAFTAGYHMDKDGTGQGLFRVKQICDAFGAKIGMDRDYKGYWPVNFYIDFKTV